MNSIQITPPIGLAPLRSAVEEICGSAAAYRRGSVAPCHFILALDSGNGRTTLVQHMTDMFLSHRIRHFGGLDPFLEYKLDGSMAQLKQVLGSIRDSAVYTNRFNGIVALDVAAMAAHINEPAGQLFLTEITELAEEATLIFFFPGTMNRNMELLADKISKALDNVQIIPLPDYTEDELARIAEAAIEDSGVEILDQAEFHEAMKEIILSCGIRSAREATRLAAKVIRFADYTHFQATIHSQHLQSQSLHQTNRG